MKVKKSRFLEKVKSSRKHSIYCGLAACSLCVGIAFMEKILTTTCWESDFLFLNKKLKTVADIVQKLSLRGS